MKAKRSINEQPQWLLSPGLKQAPVLDLICPHFVLNLAAHQGARFNLRRDLSSLMARSDQLLPAAGTTVNGKAWVNQSLESNTVPTLYVSHRIKQIGPAFRRRLVRVRAWSARRERVAVQ